MFKQAVTHRYPTLLSMSSQVSFLWALSQSYSQKVSQHKNNVWIKYQVSLCDHRLMTNHGEFLPKQILKVYCETILQFFRHSNLMINSNITIQEICKCYVMYHVACTFYFVYCILYQTLDTVIFWNGIDIVFSWYQRLNYIKVMQLELIWA